MGGFQGAFTYLPGGVAQSVSSAPVVGGQVPAGGLNPELLQRLLAGRASEAQADRAAERANRSAMQQAGLAAMQQDAQLRQAAINRSSPDSGGGERSQQQQQAQPPDRGKPIFTKTVGGPGMTPGTIRLNQWEPGAAFAGYEADLGAAPSSSHVQAPGMSRADLGASPPSNQPWSGGYNAGQNYAGVGGPGGGMSVEGPGSYEGPLSPRNMMVNAYGRSERGMANREDDASAQRRALLSVLPSAGRR